VPLMLDESIYSEAEIERAAQIGAAFVKLKLMKCVSLDRLVKELILIRDLGMKPVLGNGVAGDIGCWMEACVARKHIRNAGEMNGFLRPLISLAWPPLCLESGALQLDPAGAPRLDEAALEKATLETARFDKPVRRAGAAQ
jgi:L-alanine-DL-glutamate epimerase-like enolase superfamily enzyme